MNTIGIIGGGNMGTAIINGINKKYKVRVCEKDKKRSFLLRRKFHVVSQDLRPLVQTSNIIIVAVKPQDIDAVLKEVRDSLTKDKLIISIAAGITTSFIEKRLGAKIKVIRSMPNMPAQIGEGITAVCKGKFATKTNIRQACQIFDFVGKTVVVKETWMDAITAVSGSGPAYVFLFAECFIKAANALGLPSVLCHEMVKSTLLGSVHLLDKQNEDAAVLRAKVTSKGGTTQAAMDVFSKNKLDKVFKQALAAAKRRARELRK